RTARLRIRCCNGAIESQSLETRRLIKNPRSRVQLQDFEASGRADDSTPQLTERITDPLLYNERQDEAHSCSDREVDRRNYSCRRARGGFLFHCVSSLLSRLE